MDVMNNMNIKKTRMIHISCNYLIALDELVLNKTGNKDEQEKKEKKLHNLITKNRFRLHYFF